MSWPVFLLTQVGGSNSIPVYIFMALEHVMQANTQLCLKLDSMCSPQPYIRDMILGHYGKRFESDSKNFMTDKKKSI